MSQESYPGFQEQTFPQGDFKKSGKKIHLFILLIAVLLIGLYFSLKPFLFPNSIKGDLIDLTYVPGVNGSSGKLWIQTDGSFSYISKTSSPGKTSVGRKGIFCKTYSYVYDPEKNKILQVLKLPYDELPPPQKVFYKDGKVWVVSKEYGEYEPMINIYDAETTALVSDTKDFISKNSELISGITTLRIEEEPKRFSITTHDGKEFVYSVDKGKVFLNDQDLKIENEKENGDENVTIFALGNEEGSAPRKNVFKVTGPYSQIVSRNVSQSLLNNSKSLKFMNNAEAEMLVPGKVFLEGIILYQDKELVVILHQSQIGKNAARMLTCIDISGKEKWTADQNTLFENMGVSEKNPFSDIFFMKDKFKMERSGNLFIFKFDPTGVIGLDAGSGKKLWELDI